MKNQLYILFFISFLVIGCNNEDGVKGNDRIFSLIPETEEGWPGATTYAAINYTWQVVAAGGDRGWVVSFETPPGEFSVTENHESNTFTVSVPQNDTEDTRSVTLKITYNDDIWTYLQLSQIANYISYSIGEMVEGGAYRYTINSDGTARYKGTLFVPGGFDFAITFDSGDEGVTADTYQVVIEDDCCTPDMYSISFTTTDLLDYIGWRDARFLLSIDKPDFEDVELMVRQYGYDTPDGAIVDPTAPGGYYYRLRNNGLDVAGEDLDMYDGQPTEGMTWNFIFDPTGSAVPNVTSWADVITLDTPNPCPEGWRLLSLADAERLMGGTIGGSSYGAYRPDTGYPANYTGSGGNRVWYLADNKQVGNIFSTGTDGPAYYQLVTCTIGAHASTKQFARLNVSPNLSVLEITIAGRTTAITKNTNNTRYGLRCVRDSQ